MAKSSLSWCELQKLVERQVEHELPGTPIIPSVQHWSDQIVWNQGVGRVPWRVGYILPSADSPERAKLPMLNAAMEKLQARYDLYFICK